jgi:hypothetical protein
MHHDKLKISLAQKILSIENIELLERVSALINEDSEIIGLSASGVPLNLKK